MMQQPSRFRRIHVIVNPASGRHEPILNTLHTVFEPHGIDWDVSLTRPPVTARELARRAAGSGVDLVAVYGGDGTVMEAVNGLIGTPMPVALLPGGTGNIIAAALGLPRRLRPAAELLCRPDVRLCPVDVGQVDGQNFLMRVDVGYGVEVLKRTSRPLKGRFGAIAYLAGAFGALLAARSTPYCLTIDGQSYQSRGVACIVANLGTIGNAGSLTLPSGRALNANTDPYDGRFDIFVVRRNLAALLSVFTSLLQGRELDGAAEHWRGRDVSVTIHPGAAQDYAVDGDIWRQTPFSATMLPQAVRIVVPPAR